MFFIIFNLTNTYNAFNISKHGYVPITNEHHDQFIPFYEKYKQNITNDSVIITSLSGPFFWHNMVDINDNKLYEYYYKNPNRFKRVDKIVSENSKGWIILDWRRNGRWTKGLPRKNFHVNDIEVNYLERISAFDVYQWEKK